MHVGQFNFRLVFVRWILRSAYNIVPNNSCGAGSGSYHSSKIQRFSEKLNIFIFIIFNDLLPILQPIFSTATPQMSRKDLDPARSVVNWFPDSDSLFRITDKRIRKKYLRIYSTVPNLAIVLLERVRRLQSQF